MNAVAPEGATHLIDEHRFVKWIYGAEYEFSIYGQDKWSPAMNSYSLEDYANENIWQVLANPAAPEWEGLVPAVGDECEYQPDPKWNEWCGGMFLAEIDGEYFILINGGNKVDRMRSIPSRIRPIRTPAERVRDSAIDHAFSKLSEFREARQVLGDLYDAGLLTRAKQS